MANLPTSSSNISYHLTDRALTPLVSSSTNHPQSQSQSQAQALSSLTTAAITAFDAASRLGLGIPVRLLIETNSSGPLILCSYLNPQSSPQLLRGGETGGARGIVEDVREDLRPLSGTTEGSSAAGGEGISGLVNGMGFGKDADGGEGEGNGRQSPPLLIGTVVARSREQAGEAKRLAAGLEGVGREFQKEWVREQEAEIEPAESGETSEDG